GALGLEDADDLDVDVLDANLLSHGRIAVEELGGDGLPDEADRRGTLHVTIGEVRALGDVPVGDFEIVGRGAIHLVRLPVLVAVNQLQACPYVWRRVLDGRALVEDRLPVGGGKVDAGSAAEAHAAALDLARLDHEHVGAHLGDGALDGGRRALPDLHHRDDRRHADDDAQAGEHRSGHIPPQGADGGAQCTVNATHISSIFLKLDTAPPAGALPAHMNGGTSVGFGTQRVSAD